MDSEYIARLKREREGYKRDFLAARERAEQLEASYARTVPVPVRTLQPGDVIDDGRTVRSVTPHFGRLAIRFEEDDTLWRAHGDSIIRLRTTHQTVREEL